MLKQNLQLAWKVAQGKDKGSLMTAQMAAKLQLKAMGVALQNQDQLQVDQQHGKSLHQGRPQNLPLQKAAQRAGLLLEKQVHQTAVVQPPKVFPKVKPAVTQKQQ